MGQGFEQGILRKKVSAHQNIRPPDWAAFAIEKNLGKSDCSVPSRIPCRMAYALAGAAAAEALLHCATCDDALRILQEKGLYEAVLHRLAGRIDEMLPYKCGDMEAGAILFSKEYGYLCETKDAAALLRRIKED